MAKEASLKPKLYFNIIAKDKIAAIGLARPLPVISGAEPWTGSYKPWFFEFKVRIVNGIECLKKVM